MNQKKQRKVSLSAISIMHYWKLCFRSLLFLSVLLLYIFEKPSSVTALSAFRWELLVIWILFVIEMILRFFPSKQESMGCQKQFLRNYRPSEGRKDNILPEQAKHSVLYVALSWICLNAVIGSLYFYGVIDQFVLLLISLAYSVCDMICILFFCPFQTWMMKNKCCGTCRIYNWDYAMMFTPLIFVPRLYTWSLLGIALLLLITWEMFYKFHPERFSESTNASLHCVNCPEKLCHHKKQLHRFWTREKDRLRRQMARAHRRKEP